MKILETFIIKKYFNIKYNNIIEITEVKLAIGSGLLGSW